MESPTTILKWSSVNPEDWGFQHQNQYNKIIIFELTRLPNFAEPRFRELGDGLEDRKMEVAKRQTQMLRQLHSLNDCAIALRLRRDHNRLRLFVVARLSSRNPITATEQEKMATRVQHMFPQEYSLRQIFLNQDQKSWELATDLGWANYADELFKPEDTHKANAPWPFFYVAQLWQSQAMNDMELLCRTLLRFTGEAMVDITFVPTKFDADERDWLDRVLQKMRETQNGERLYGDSGKLLKTFDAMPSLRVPLENYENLIKRYDQSRLFLTAFRVFASEEPAIISQALTASASRSQTNIVRLDRHHPLFSTAHKAAQIVDIAPSIRTQFWDGDPQTRPFRAQRLHRLADLEELASFWRFPIPAQAGFPGFELDIGGTKHQSDGQPRLIEQINLGQFTDDTAESQLDAILDREGLAKHGLVVGVPGSGKTTAMFNLLYQLWNPSRSEYRVPFIVLEPAKTEYRALKEIKSFKEDLLIFSLGDERTSPFRFNPFEVPSGIPLESHISRLNACFTGAFSLFDPLPLLLDKAIRETYETKGWFDDSVGGEPGLVIPTLSDLCTQAELVIKNSGYSDKLRDDFNAALLQRLESLKRGSKGRMLDTKESVPFGLLMERPVILELDALNEDEKSLLMMFILTFVYEYAKATRRSGSPLRHVLLVEEAHNLIGRGDTGGSEFRANPKEQSIRLFVRMLAEMRALGQGILIADQLPTALAPEAVKQTNLKVLMRMTAMDDRLEIGNTMDLGEAELKAVTRFKSGQAYVYLEEWDRVRQIQMPNFKGDQNIDEPPDDITLTRMMESFERENPDMFMPFAECPIGCQQCNRRVRSQAERFVQPLAKAGRQHINNAVIGDGPWSTVCRVMRLKAISEADRLQDIYTSIDPVFAFCAYVHLLHAAPDSFELCSNEISHCDCKQSGRDKWFEEMLEVGQTIATDRE